MKQTEKNSSKQVNSVNNETLSVETIKAQLKAACAEMDAGQTKEYIEKLDGYSIKKTGANPTRVHYTIYYGELRICNVENVQGIKADGTPRGCVSVARVKSSVENMNNFFEKIKTIDYMTEEEFAEFDKARSAAAKQLSICDDILNSVNNRIAEEAKAAAKLKRETKKGKKAAEKLDNSTLLQVLIAKGIDESEAKRLLQIA